MLIEFILILVLVVILGSVAWTLFSLAPYLPTRHKDYQRISALANLKENEKFIDLGCGFGGLLQHLSQKNQNVFGIELNILIFIFC